MHIIRKSKKQTNTDLLNINLNQVYILETEDFFIVENNKQNYNDGLPNPDFFYNGEFYTYFKILFKKSDYDLNKVKSTLKDEVIFFDNSLNQVGFYTCSDNGYSKVEKNIDDILFFSQINNKNNIEACMPYLKDYAKSNSLQIFSNFTEKTDYELHHICLTNKQNLLLNLINPTNFKFNKKIFLDQIKYDVTKEIKLNLLNDFIDYYDFKDYSNNSNHYQLFDAYLNMFIVKSDFISNLHIHLKKDVALFNNYIDKKEFMNSSFLQVLENSFDSGVSFLKEKLECFEEHFNKGINDSLIQYIYNELVMSLEYENNLDDEISKINKAIFYIKI